MRASGNKIAVATRINGHIRPLVNTNLMGAGEVEAGIDGDKVGVEVERGGGRYPVLLSISMLPYLPLCIYVMPTFEVEGDKVGVER
jgi:hypothetical protein